VYKIFVKSHYTEMDGYLSAGIVLQITVGGSLVFLQLYWGGNR